MEQRRACLDHRGGLGYRHAERPAGASSATGTKPAAADSSPGVALLDHAKKGPEQLRRVALGLVITWAEDRLRSEENWLDPFIHEHYRLLGDLGYQPSEIETQELARVGAAEPPDEPGEHAAEQGDS